jgi:hypothetical protein
VAAFAAVRATPAAAPPCTPKASVPRLLALRGGLSLQATSSIVGSAVSLSGLAMLVDPKWVESKSILVASREDVWFTAPVAEHSRARAVVSGLLLIGWGAIKIAFSRRGGKVLETFCRFNCLPMALGLAVQARHGAAVLPMHTQSCIAAVYACSTFGVSPPRLRMKKDASAVKDRFLEYLPEKRVHLA